jgi:hypothetical protein
VYMNNLRPRVCRTCLQRLYSTIRGVETSPNRLSGILILEESDTNNSKPIVRTPAHAQQPSIDFDPLPERASKTLTSTEKLSRDLRKRLQGRRHDEKRDLVTRFSKPGTTIKLRGRTPSGQTTSISNRISPVELLQNPEGTESDNSMNIAIESCLRTALYRLQLPSLNLPGSIPGTVRSIPHEQYLWLCSIVNLQFTKPQLVRYGTTSGLFKSHLLRLKKEQVIDEILRKIWKVEKEEGTSSEESMVTKCCLPFHYELIDSNPHFTTGAVLHDWTRSVLH